MGEQGKKALPPRCAQRADMGEQAVLTAVFVFTFVVLPPINVTDAGAGEEGTGVGGQQAQFLFGRWTVVLQNG